MSFLRRLLGRPEPIDDGSPFEARLDPPFLFAKRTDRSRANRVINDVYGRTRKGRKWHRIYEVDHRFADAEAEGLRRHGRSYTFACGDGVFEQIEVENHEFVSAVVVEGVPEADICRSCRASDRVWGKGEIKDKSQWERWA